MSDNNSEKLKKNEYYARGEDSDFIEEEKEAIAIQNKRLQRMIDLNLVENNNKLENSDDENKSDSSISYNKFKDTKNNKKSIKDIIKNKGNLINNLLSDSEDEKKNSNNNNKNNKKDKSNNNLLKQKRSKVVESESEPEPESDNYSDNDEEYDSNEEEVEEDVVVNSRKSNLKGNFSNEKYANGMKIKEQKNKQMIENANKALAKGRGIYRKRKAKQGNARLMNKLKYQKKEKIRKNYVKEFTEAPLVYTGEATGIRRDLSRSIKLN